ncbi:hypothetical protein ACOYX0_09450 [Enterococcus thailandicus]|uniref:Uncharacterized protein n=3 Tax=Enterococcus thailandicus TaxID=417368 RepID=A0A1L8XLC7_ENTTH|nr:hypothetical protein [Enterococcus thailandicus]ASZ07801.1 hypothetical protein CK496_07720 [Enterococcus thailandicus]MDA3963940.1 hypothetical protein [Enterococcus thailandicus]MDK4350842.1 hypothetical protein [Enterococcus thailandicus]MDT2733504.1 hypothetical protein [Enterococcus thailandicus]MDT2750499.1 hypothetical protein [Enterococcus thailandicus]
MKELFEKETLAKLMLFSYIDNLDTDSFAVKDIEKQFDLTYFRANKLLGLLIEDFKTMELDDYFFISKNKSKYIYKKNCLDSINRLIWKYGRESYLFSLLDYFLKNGMNTKEIMENYSYYHYVSVSYSYVIKNKLEAFLEMHQMNFLVENVSESKLRIFLAQIYFYIFKNYENPFSAEEWTTAQAFIEELQELKVIEPIEKLKKTKLLYYCLVSFFRVENKQNSGDEVLLVSTDERYMEPIILSYRKFAENRDEVKTEDVITLINYLRVNHYLFQEKDSSLKKENDLMQLTRNLLTTVGIEQPDEKLNNQLYELLFKFSYYKDSLLDGHFYVILDFFFDGFGQEAERILQFLRNKETIAVIGNQAESQQLLLETLLLIINSQAYRNQKQAITITIDFTLGEEYNKYIANNIVHLPFVTLKVDNQYSAQTDIYLSDVLSEVVESEYLIWNSPPSSKDWKVFGNLVSKIYGMRNSL